MQNQMLFQKRQKIRQNIRRNFNNSMQNNSRSKLKQFHQIQQFKFKLQTIPESDSQLSSWFKFQTNLLFQISILFIEQQKLKALFQIIKLNHSIQGLQFLTRLISHLHKECVNSLLQMDIVLFILDILKNDQQILRIQMGITILSHISGSNDKYRNFIFLNNAMQLAIKVSKKNKKKINPILCFFFRCYTSYKFQQQQNHINHCKQIIQHFIKMIKQQNELLELLQGLSNCLRWQKKWCHQIFTNCSYIQFYLYLIDKNLNSQQLYELNRTLLGYLLIPLHYFQKIQNYLQQIIHVNLNILNDINQDNQRTRQDIYFLLQHFFDSSIKLQSKMLFIENGLLDTYSNALELQKYPKLIDQLLNSIITTFNCLNFDEQICNKLMENGFIKNLVSMLSNNILFSINQLTIMLQILECTLQSTVISKYILSCRILYELYENQKNHKILDKINTLINICQINGDRYDL